MGSLAAALRYSKIGIFAISLPCKRFVAVCRDTVHVGLCGGAAAGLLGEALWADPAQRQEHAAEYACQAHLSVEGVSLALRHIGKSSGRDST